MVSMIPSQVTILEGGTEHLPEEFHQAEGDRGEGIIILSWLDLWEFAFISKG
jgi:hypothetical protein